MLTLTLRLTPDRAKRVARAADAMAASAGRPVTHEEVADEALRLFLLSVAPRTNLQRRTPRRTS